MAEYSQVAVIGAGMMGHGLALVHALGGCQVAVQDVSSTALQQAPKLVASALHTLVASQAISTEDAASATARLRYTPDLAEAVAAADLVVETVVENSDVKRQVFSAINAHAPRHAVIASNTSRLDVFPLVPESRAARTLIAHWYSPPYLIGLVDVVGHPGCDAQVLQDMVSFLRRIGKKPVLFDTFVTGYVANRIQAAIALEVFALLDSGIATAQQIDDSIRYGLAERMVFQGYLKKCDFTGLELMQRTVASATYAPPPVRRSSETLDALLQRGRKGVMSSHGFYDYGGTPSDELLSLRDRRLIALRQAIDAIERDIADPGIAPG